MAYWLEQHGYDVTYCCNSDMMTPDRGLKCKAFLSVGHDEYWDIRQYESVVKMRDAGVNLMFLSGNSVCWVSPFRDKPRRSRRIASCFAADRTAETTNRPRPRARQWPLSTSRARRGLPDGRAERRSGQRRRRLGL